MMWIGGTGNHGKPRGESTYWPSTVVFTRVLQRTCQSKTWHWLSQPSMQLQSGNICYERYLREAVASTKSATNKIPSWINQANDNPGPVQYVDLTIPPPRFNNNGGARYFKLTALDREYHLEWWKHESDPTLIWIRREIRWSLMVVVEEGWR